MRIYLHSSNRRSVSAVDGRYYKDVVLVLVECFPTKHIIHHYSSTAAAQQYHTLYRLASYSNTAASRPLGRSGDVKRIESDPVHSIIRCAYSVSFPSLLHDNPEHIKSPVTKGAVGFIYSCNGVLTPVYRYVSYTTRNTPSTTLLLLHLSFSSTRY